MRAIQLIQPTSNPAKSPKAARVYTIAPPGSSKRLPASAKQSTRSSTPKPAARIAQTLAGPRSCAAATGRMRYTPLPMTSLTDSATICHRETTRRSPVFGSRALLFLSEWRTF